MGATTVLETGGLPAAVLGASAPVPRYGALDLAFFLAYVVVVLAIGFAVGRREQVTVSDYFRAGNRLPWYAIGFSIVASGISSEQFVGEMGYAYKLGMPTANWEWLVFPSLTILLWIFVPLYVRNSITTMPEYLERRFGGRSRTLYAILTIASYVFANFALVFYTGGFAIEALWGFDRLAAVWILAILTGAYTVYGGLISVTWTDFFQCALLLGGGIYVTFAGMAQIGWDFAAVIGSGERAHLIAPADHPEVPWTALVILALSTNVWYYASNQFINQRCLGAKDEWHAKMGVLVAGGLQLLLPLATIFPGLIYRVIDPTLQNPDEAYPRVVAAVVPEGLRGLVVAAVLGAIMSTISGLVNSTSTMVTLDIARRWKGKDWSERKLVRCGQISGAAALLIGALFAPAVMKWENLFRYCQDIWAPMAAPAVVVFLGGALWPGARERGALACLWLSILTVPLTFAKQILGDAGVHFLPANLENSLVFAGAVFLFSIALLVELSRGSFGARGALRLSIAGVMIALLGCSSPQAVATLLAAAIVVGIVVLCARARGGEPHLWDVSMLRLPAGERRPWYASLWLWWAAIGLGFVAIFVYFW